MAELVTSANLDVTDERWSGCFNLALEEVNYLPCSNRHALVAVTTPLYGSPSCAFLISDLEWTRAISLHSRKNACVNVPR